MRKTMAIGLASASLLAGCGEGQPARHPARHPGGEYPEQAQVQADIRYLQQPNVQYTADLDRLPANRVRQVARFSVAMANGRHDGAVYSESPPSALLTGDAKFYANVQGQLAQVAHHYKTIGLPLDEGSHARKVGKVIATMRLTTAPSAVVAVGENTISTYSQKYAKGLSAAATFKPTLTQPIHEVISFVAANKTYLADTEALATEACQAALNVTTPNPADMDAAQEVVCNTFGYTYGFADNRYNYQQYARAMDTGKFAMPTTDGHFFRYMVMPPAAFAEIQHGEPPMALAGIRTERNK